MKISETEKAQSNPQQTQSSVQQPVDKASKGAQHKKSDEAVPAKQKSKPGSETTNCNL